MNSSIIESQVEETISTENHSLKIVNAHLKFPKVHLEPPNASGYFLLALEVDAKAPLFLTESKKKKKLLQEAKELLRTIEKISYVSDVAIFKARFIPPGQGEFIKKRLDKVRIAKYDVVILIETEQYSHLDRLKKEVHIIQLENRVAEHSNFVHKTTAKNIRKMGDVDHTRQGVFLFNYFYADSIKQNLKIWEYTAGWFEDQTSLNNSTLLRTQEDDNRLYTVINHCRWDRLSDVLPSLIFKRTFKTYVLANFEANNTGPMPTLYKLA